MSFGINRSWPSELFQSSGGLFKSQPQPSQFCSLFIFIPNPQLFTSFSQTWWKEPYSYCSVSLLGWMKYISETVLWKSFRAKGDGRGSVCTSHNPSNLFSAACCGVLLLDQRCRVRHGQAPIYHSFTHDCLPHLQTCCFTASLFFLALAASLLASLRGASWLLDPCLLSFLVQLPLCLSASLIA